MGRVLLVAVVAWLLLRLLRAVDWSRVGYAMTHLSPWQILVLLLVLPIRRFVLATPLALFVTGLSVPRAMVNDVAASSVATIAPSPGDVVVRLAMLRSWGIDAKAAASGLTLSTLMFYIARLAAPVLGFLVFWIGRSFDARLGWAALVFGAGAAALLVGLIYAVRAERTAAALGRLLGSLIRKVRPSANGPEEWAERLVDFQAHSAGLLKAHGRLAAVSLCGLVVVEAGVLILCLAFVGVPMSGATVLLLGCTFLVTYPLTGLPLMGAGVLDASYAAFVSSHSDLEATTLVAGLLVWRVAVQVVPVVVGLLTLVRWRHLNRGTVSHRAR
ncbi:lysylphosphatidylglycerol synthase domain-containing protein [Kribbella sp.]|uniref:lysylphosphatidylglycerol synthase domain-containing protein n=1 Tax=Kribbella sp. TaxID=1871183 RepID=UPI002D339C84|nr:lysylphosphatidylglycerol synthase domain-containing protein [Kribbella sp.]HZX04428.1 lysylphosphatidylglycerol synthase domain-containing protein [Kribbella sp.]